jgi:predicted AlkP superfamily phosphohydrolase/phosphomutase
MSRHDKINRRTFLQQSGLTAAGLSVFPNGANAGRKIFTKSPKIIIIGFDGMDPGLSEKMMDAGELPTFAALRKRGGYSRLITSDPPQSPVAWANFINGAGPGSHGIFDFIHRDPSKQCAPFFSAAETVEGEGHIDFRGHQLQLNFWPFNHMPTQTLLRREGTPFWHYLDQAGIPSTFYDLPSNYPPSESEYGNHRCLSGMGTPDMLGTYGTYQHFSEDGPVRTKDEPGGQRSMLFFENEKAQASLTGPKNGFLKTPTPIKIPFTVYRDTASKAAVIKIQDHTIVLNEKQWSPWLPIDFQLSLPAPIPDEHVSGICRFYLQETAPNFRLYVTPINIDPSDPAVTVSEPPELSQEISSRLGLFYTSGFQEDHKALANGIFSADEYASQAQMVLDERLNLFDYALDDYDDGVLYFYFSSTDLQSHMFWWDSDQDHPVRPRNEANHYFNHIKDLYRMADGVMKRLLQTYGDSARIFAMSDHGFANFRRQFSLNTWLKDNGYLPGDTTSVLGGVDWRKTRAYGLGINGLYLNLEGREEQGIVSTTQKDALLDELAEKLEAVRDVDGRKVIKRARRSDRAYSGPHTALAPDLILGYSREYRAAWNTCLGDLDKEVFLDNDSAWGADHCCDSSEVPGVLFCNKPILKENPALTDLAPTFLAEYGLPVPSSMTGRALF